MKSNLHIVLDYGALDEIFVKTQFAAGLQLAHVKLCTHHVMFVGTTIVEWPAHTMGRPSADRSHHATAVGCTHDGRQQLKQIANLADIRLSVNENRSSPQATLLRPSKNIFKWNKKQTLGCITVGWPLTPCDARQQLKQIAHLAVIFIPMPN